MSDTLKPILFVAFGDPKNDREAALPALEAEQKNICSALKDVWALGSWEYVSGLNCTRAELVEQFNSDRVTIFHFGGHASPQSLLLPAEAEGKQVVSGVLLEDFLARQKSLKVAFFNACSTERWAAGLAESIPYVVATISTVDDRMALDFASTFYAKLAADLTVEDAFAQASAAVVLQHEELKPPPEVAESDAVLSRYRRMSVEDDEPAAFPWILCRKPNLTRDERTWSLSAGAKDPLIGLPLLDLAEYPLPERPYVSIKGHAEADAPLFFGRRAEIRTLYDWAQGGAGSPPILLFYGQSGAGKSSLLNAGLLPRLKKRCAVEYRRRSVDLLEDFCSAVGGSLDEADAAIEAWTKSDEPRLVILDQVEEAITHRTATADARDELTAFLARLTGLFVNAKTGQLRFPQSKARLILSFRKEYVPEIRTPLVSALPQLVTDVWLERLDGARVVEVIEGPVRTAALRDQYRITLDNGFAEYVASRLNDPNSPIATVLQIVLNKLWDEARKNGDPVYTRALYDGLSALDNPLHGFYGEQLDRLYALEDGARYSNGIELDLLVEHTSDLGTSRRRTLAELKTTYPKVAGLEELIQKNKDLYLLAEPPREDGDETAEPATTLTHDTLAPVIRRDFALSLTAGARARRLLENRAREWVDGKTGEPLDALDLRVVSKGLKDMRALGKNEQRMLKFSRKRVRRNLGIAAAIVAGIAAIGGGLALYERAQEEAQARTKDAIRLASEAKTEAASNYDLAVLLSIAAYKSDASHFEVRDAITSVYEARPEAIGVLHPKNPMTYVQGGMAFSLDGRLLAAPNGNQLELWDVRQRTRLWWVETGTDLKSSFDSILFTSDGRWLVLGSDYQPLQVRDAATGALRKSGLPGAPEHVEAAAMGKAVFIASGGCNLQVWSVTNWTPALQKSTHLEGCAAGDAITNVAINPKNDASFALRWFDGKVMVGTKTLRQPTPREERRDDGNYILAYSGDGTRLVATTRFGDLEVFDTTSGKLMGMVPAVAGVRFTGVALNQDGSRLAAFAGGRLGEWDTRSMLPVRPMRERQWAGLNDAVVSPDFSLIAVRGPNGDLLLLDNDWGIGGVPPFDASDAKDEDSTLPVVFSPDGKWIATGTKDGDVFLWDATTRKVVWSFEGGENDGWVNTLAFSADSKKLVWPIPGPQSREMVGFNAVEVPGGQKLGDYSAPREKGESDIAAAALTPDGRLVAVTKAGVVRIWDLRGGAAKVLDGRTGMAEIFGIAISPSGNYLAAPRTNDRVVGLFSLENGQPVQPEIDLKGMTEESADLHAAAGSGDEMLAEGHPYGISVWDLKSGKSLGSASLGETVPRSVKFSPDGKLLAVGMDGAVRLWDVGAGQWIGQDLMDTDDSLMVHVAFSPDGKRIVWSGDHGSVGEWDWNLDLDKWVERGCAIAGRNLTVKEWKQHLPDRPYQELCPKLPGDRRVH